MRRSFSLLAILVPVTLAIAGFSSSDMLPLDDDAIQYNTSPANDPVIDLQQRIDKGQTKLKYEGDLGYLKSVLDALDISTT